MLLANSIPILVKLQLLGCSEVAACFSSLPTPTKATFNLGLLTSAPSSLLSLLCLLSLVDKGQGHLRLFKLTGVKSGT